MGNPLKHSKSPRIHQLFAHQFDIPLHYARIQVDLGGFAQAVSHFAAQHGTGLNITAPFKMEAWQLCQRPANRLSETARTAEAVNTLHFTPDGKIHGDNTDGIGLLRDLQQNLNWQIADKRILILGAGGAVRGILAPLLQRAPARILIANRTAEKAKTLAQAFHPQAKAAKCTLTACALPQLAPNPSQPPFDLLINATSATLNGNLPSALTNLNLTAHLHPNTLAYDMVYAPDTDTKTAAPTAFIRWARENGITHAHDGLGMLVEQAAESFYLWHNKRPDTAPVLAALRNLSETEAEAVAETETAESK